MQKGGNGLRVGLRMELRRMQTPGSSAPIAVLNGVRMQIFMRRPFKRGSLDSGALVPKQWCSIGSEGLLNVSQVVCGLRYSRVVESCFIFRQEIQNAGPFVKGGWNRWVREDVRETGIRSRVCRQVRFLGFPSFPFQ